VKRAEVNQIASLTEDLPGIIDDLTDAVADWLEPEGDAAEKREMRDQAEDTITEAVRSLINLVQDFRKVVEP
jgi:hypothetical protein